MRCLICGTEFQNEPCPICGFDGSQCRELKPTLADDGLRLRPLWSYRREIWEQAAKTQGIKEEYARQLTELRAALEQKETETDALQAEITALRQTAGPQRAVRNSYENPVFRCTLSTGLFHTVGLRWNGTVCAAGVRPEGLVKLSQWQDIVDISAGFEVTVGLRRDGTVCCVKSVHDQKNLSFISRQDFAVSSWQDVVAISAGANHAVGLRRDGTVLATCDPGQNYRQCEVEDWRDITAVSAGFYHTVGLREDGTVCAVGMNDYGQCSVSNWTDIVAISAGSWHTVGLRRNGTVLAVGRNHHGQCSVADWTDIIAISASSHHTVGLRRDRTIVAVGDNSYGQCNLAGWNDIALPGTMLPSD